MGEGIAKRIATVFTRDMNTATATTDHTVRITCDCDICKANAERHGLEFPLAALIRPLTATGLGITAKNAGRKTKTHGLVYAAHDPSLRGYKGTRISIAA